MALAQSLLVNMKDLSQDRETADTLRIGMKIVVAITAVLGLALHEAREIPGIMATIVGTMVITEADTTWIETVVTTATTITTETAGATLEIATPGEVLALEILIDGTFLFCVWCFLQDAGKQVSY